jgi:uncharacterized membrane protein
LIVLLVVTWVVDLLWMFYWIPHWSSDEMKDWQRGLHNFVIFISFVNFIMKLAVIAMLWLTQREFIQKNVAALQNDIKSGNIGGL